MVHIRRGVKLTNNVEYGRSCVRCKQCGLETRRLTPYCLYCKTKWVILPKGVKPNNINHRKC